MTMKGVPLTTYAKGTFGKVAKRLQEKPAQGVDYDALFGPRVAEWIREERGLKPGEDLLKAASSIPMKVMSLLSTEDMCKLRFGAHTTLCHSVEEAFKKGHPTLHLFDKIRSSFWRWGSSRGLWNEVAEAFDGIASFDLGNPAFELTLDYSTGCNERGWSEHSRTFLDGVFGYLVHFKGEHVMTIGFSLMAGRRVLVQQVQAKNRTGNRWLFKLPRDLLSHVVDRFQAAFPGHQVLVVDGSDLIGETITSYKNGLERAKDQRQRAKDAIERLTTEGAKEESIGLWRHSLGSAERDIAEFKAKLAHARAEKPRIEAAYRLTGRHAPGAVVKSNGIRHYVAEAAVEQRLAA